MTVYIQYACNKDNKYYSFVNICQTVQLKMFQVHFTVISNRAIATGGYIGIYTPKSVPKNYFVH